MNRITRKIISLTLVLMLALSLMPASVFASADSSASVKAVTKAAGTSIQDGVTLHCWNWSFANIEANLDAIAAAGYTAIQTSPIQPLKESTKESWSTYGNHWWVTYQPTEFKINTATNNALGTKTQFASMCEAAEKKGIKVIVDVVANHLANGSGNDVSTAVPSYLRSNAAYWHDISKNTSNWWDRYEVTQYCLAGLPDLNTGNKDIQNYVLAFLKECVDAGADGFRFDAAKHIEVPEDSYCGSDFWPTVINGIKSYKSDVYVYGEMLDDTGGTSFSNYTEYMSITDNRWSDKVRENVINSGNAGNFYSGYDNGVSADKLVLWAESHDTYGNEGGASMYDSTQNINKTWALVAARADAMSLYLARPDSFSQKLGVASTNTGWNWEEVVAVNNFHNHFAGQGEYISNSNGYAMVERGTSGAVIVNVGSDGNVNIPVYKMANGTYVDQVSGATFTVSNGRISGKISHQCGYAVIYNACNHSWSTTSTTPATCTTDGSVKSTCTLCGEIKTEVISAIGHTYVNGSCSVCGAAQPEDYVLYFSNNGSWSNVNVYYWSDADNAMVTWPGKAMTSLGNGIYTYTVPAEATYVIFNDGSNQTADLKIPASYNYYYNGTWTTYSSSGTSCSHTSHNTNGVCTSCGTSVGHTYVNNVCSVCGATKGTSLSTDYYLIGYINGSNYGCESDSANMGDYKFVDGKVKATFNSDSYVFVKTANNANWYMTDGWLGTDVTSATLYNTSTLGATADKLFVPAGTEYEFTLVENGDGTVTLSYAEPGCEHSYTSKVTTAATCSKEGVKTYTCSKCGNSYTETIAKLSHSWTDATCTAPKTCTVCGATEGDALAHSWTDATCTAPKTCTVCGATEGEALGHASVTYSFANNTHTFTCDVCGEVAFTKDGSDGKQFKIASAQPELASNIVMYLGAQLPAGFSDPRIEVEFNGETSYLYESTINSLGRYEFAFDRINPKIMSDTFVATLYATVEGYEVSAKLEYSMLKYLNSQLKKSSLSAANRTVMSDLIAYGDANQIYANYKADALISTLLAETATLTPSTFTALDASYNVQKVITGENRDLIDFKTVTLVLDSKVVVSVKVYCPNAEGYSVNVNLAGVDYTYPVSELEPIEGEDGYYYLNFEEIRASQFDEVVTVSFLNAEGTQISRTLEYSVYTYIQKNQNSTDTKLVNLLKAIYNYGEAAKKI